MVFCRRHRALRGHGPGDENSAAVHPIPARDGANQRRVGAVGSHRFVDPAGSSGGRNWAIPADTGGNTRQCLHAPAPRALSDSGLDFGIAATRPSGIAGLDTLELRCSGMGQTTKIAIAFRGLLCDSAMNWLSDTPSVHIFTMRNSYPLGIMSLSPTMRASRCWRASNVRKLLNSSSSALAMCKISSVRQPIVGVCSRLS